LPLAAGMKKIGKIFGKERLKQKRTRTLVGGTEKDIDLATAESITDLQEHTPRLRKEK
jgi:hypothetical protein